MSNKKKTDKQLQNYAAWQNSTLKKNEHIKTNHKHAENEQTKLVRVWQNTTSEKFAQGQSTGSRVHAHTHVHC